MDLLTRKEAAQYLHIGITKLAALVKSGKIIYRQDTPGGKMLFSRTDLDHYDESRRVIQKRPVDIYGTFRKRRVKSSLSA